MRKFEVKPKNRDKQAKEGYKTLDRLIRKNQDYIEREMDMLFEDMILHGTCIVKDGKRVDPTEIYENN